jgi:hypothetical protein
VLLNEAGDVIQHLFLPLCKRHDLIMGEKKENVKRVGLKA